MAWLFQLLVGYPAKLVAGLLVAAVIIGTLVLTVASGIWLFRVISSHFPDHTRPGSLGRSAASVLSVLVAFYVGMILYAARDDFAFLLLESLKSLD